MKEAPNGSVTTAIRPYGVVVGGHQHRAAALLDRGHRGVGVGTAK